MSEELFELLADGPPIELFNRTITRMTKAELSGWVKFSSSRPDGEHSVDLLASTCEALGAYLKDM